MLARIVVSILAGWLTAALLVALASQIFSTQHMDVVASAVVVLAFVVLVLTWRATRSFIPREATAEDLRDGFDVHLSATYWTVIIGFGLATFGLFGLAFWLVARAFPRRLDHTGLTLRNGSKLSWHDYKRHEAKRMGFFGVPAGTKLVFVFGDKADKTGRRDTKVVVSPLALAEAPAVNAFLACKLRLELPAY